MYARRRELHDLWVPCEWFVHRRFSGLLGTKIDDEMVEMPPFERGSTGVVPECFCLQFSALQTMLVGICILLGPHDDHDQPPRTAVGPHNFKDSMGNNQYLLQRTFLRLFF